MDGTVNVQPVLVVTSVPLASVLQVATRELFSVMVTETPSSQPEVPTPPVLPRKLITVPGAPEDELRTIVAANATCGRSATAMMTRAATSTTLAALAARREPRLGISLPPQGD
jgi:hypothetical protein